MGIKNYFKLHSTLDYEINEYENSFVKFLYIVFNFLQNYLTISSFARSFFYYIEKRKNFHNIFIPLWVFGWLIGIIVLYFSNLNNKIVVIFYSYRLWEIFIVNIWMFIFRRRSQSISVFRKKENNCQTNFVIRTKYTKKFLF
jgi:hypothetical protein